jgi:hypothetical protein
MWNFAPCVQKINKTESFEVIGALQGCVNFVSLSSNMCICWRFAYRKMVNYCETLWQDRIRREK